MIGILLACVLQEPVVEVEARPAAVSPKFRLRDGEDGFAGESVFSRELDAEGDVPSPGVAARLVWEDFRVEAGFRELRARGDGTLDEDKNWGGRVVPAGTESDTDVLFRHAELGGFGIVPLAEGLRLEVGAFLEYMLVDADLGFGRTRLGGVFPTPRLRLAAEPWPWLEGYASAGGVFVPFRSGGALCASKIADAQAAFESANTMQPTILGGVNFVLHAAGWLEGGLAFGYEKFVMDADQCGMWHAFAKGVDLSENGQALEAILSNEPGVHFLGHPHTLANFETAFYRSQVADNNSVEQWELDGSKDAAQRANEIWKRMLAEYEPPPIDEAIDEELREWIERRKASFPDAYA